MRVGALSGLLASALLPVLAACTPAKGTVLGQAPRGEPKTILAVKAGDTPPQVTLSGTMIEKCPTAGCWFRLKDDSGVIKVDTKSAGFVVVNVPLEARVVVSGRVTLDGEETAIQATGIRF